MGKQWFAMSMAWRGLIVFGTGAMTLRLSYTHLDLLELDGEDLRREPLTVRKATLASLLSRTGKGLRLNEHLEHGDGAEVFAHACRMGLEGIVSKRKDSRYISGRSQDWIKS